MFFSRRNKDKFDAESDDDTCLIEMARVDESGFGLLYERYFQRIYNYCLRRVEQPEEAEDLTSLIFTRAWAGLDNFRGGSVAAWLFQIAHNSVANHLRGRKSLVSLEVAVTSGWTDLLAEPDEGTLDKLVRREERQEVAKLIAALPAQQRELLALSVAGKLTAREIGQVLGKSEGAVWMAFHRVVQRLRAEYMRQNQGEEV